MLQVAPQLSNCSSLRETWLGCTQHPYCVCWWSDASLTCKVPHDKSWKIGWRKTEWIWRIIVLYLMIFSTFLCHIVPPLKEGKVEMFSFFPPTVQSLSDTVQVLDFWCSGARSPSTTAAPLQNTDLKMNELESVNMLRPRLDSQLDGLALVPTMDAATHSGHSSLRNSRPLF